MLMNSDELLLKIENVLQESGIIQDVTDFMHEHPEYWCKCSDYHSEICGMEISIAMVDEPRNRLNAGPFIMMNLGACNSEVRVSLNDHSRSTGSKIELIREYNGERVSRKEVESVRN